MKVCPAPRCRRHIPDGAFACRDCYQRVPASVRTDIEMCIRRGWAFSPLSPLWRTAEAAALDHLNQLPNPAARLRRPRLVA